MKNILLASAFFLLLFTWQGISALAQEATAEKFDEVPAESCCESLWARLDNYLVKLSDNPNARAYIIYYEGKIGGCSDRPKKTPKRGAAENRVRLIKYYMVTTRGFDENNIVIINGGFREDWTAELWLLPPGAESPKPTPTIDGKSFKFRKGKLTAKDYEFPYCA